MYTKIIGMGAPTMLQVWVPICLSWVARTTKHASATKNVFNATSMFIT